MKLSKTWIILGGATLAVILFLTIYIPLSLNNEESNDKHQLAIRVLESVPLIDGHNDLPYNLERLINNQLELLDLRQNLSLDSVWGSSVCDYCRTDIPRLREGRVASVFWVAYVVCESQYKDVVARTMGQIDVIKRMIDKYSDEMQLVTSVKGIEEAFLEGKIGSLIAVEGGHSIDSRLAVLRLFYEMGTRYMTLTHACSDKWIDASPVDDPQTGKPVHNGLSEFGKIVIREMNRLGMMVDLSHVSKEAQLAALEVTRAPIIFSHSGVFNVCAHHRNVHDDVLVKVAQNNGIVMVNFYSDHVACGPNATIYDVIAHINHIKNVAGANHIGIGADYDGVPRMPEGLEDVSKYPELFTLLVEDDDNPWSEEELRKLAGLNFLRVFKEVEKVRDQMAIEGITPYEDLIPAKDISNDTTSYTTR